MAKFQIDLLDVGAIEYGDSILIQAGGLTALIDGGKLASGTATTAQVLGETVNHQPIDVQVKKLLGGITVDLLIITHCHSDHIGCLPRLFADGRLKCKSALVADPQLGYGITADSAPPPTDLAMMQPREKLRLALHQEPVSSSDAADIREFIEDSARDFTDYLGFLKSLKLALGAKYVEYRGLAETDSPGLTALLAAMAPMKLKIYGPSLTQLVRCAGFLEGRSEDDPELDPIAQALTQTEGDLVAAYRALQPISSDADVASDSTGENGNAVNNQSIVLSLGDAAHRVLLTGDMQFMHPQLADPELKTEMKHLVDAVLADAPFEFVKLAHHGATNGQNIDFLRKLRAPMFAISTGSRSLKHPPEPVLKDLNTLVGEGSTEFARVDINGRCRFSVVNGKGRLSVTRNDLNDMTPPAQRSGDAVEVPTPVEPQVPSIPAPAPITTTSEVLVQGGPGPVEVVVRIPPGVSKVSVVIEVTGSPLA